MCASTRSDLAIALAKHAHTAISVRSSRGERGMQSVIRASKPIDVQHESAPS
jgi:hypothetical protein